MIAIVALIVAIGGFFYNRPLSSLTNYGATAAGGLLAENYLPFVMYNNGYQSAKDISTSANIYGSSLTLATTNSATTTLAVGCIQTTATSTQSPIRFTLTPYVGTSTSQGGLSNFLVAAQFGTCPI